ncbi:MAG: hypothetical protein H7222_03670 [Methylotenera sp.]|nr:hypothetical protein [Oligoflexia bacterium]
MKLKTDTFFRVVFISGGILLGAVILWLSDLAPHRSLTGNAPVQPEVANVKAAALAPLAVASSAPQRRISSVLPVNREQLWSQFQSNFGSALEPRYFPDGRLASVQAGAKAGTSKPGFNPKDPQQAIARGREILSAAAELIGVRPDLPLENPLARGTDESVQVSFKETNSGYELAPGGALTLQLGAEGELIGLYADYITPLEVMNQPVLDVESARNKVETTSSSPEKIEGGRPLLWVGEVGEHPQARHAFEFWVHGRQIIIDAQTGETLLRRDRRHF